MVSVGRPSSFWLATICKLTAAFYLACEGFITLILLVKFYFKL